MADTLFLSKGIIDGHRQALLEKTGIRNTVALAVYCFKKKLKKLEDVG